MPTKSNIFKQYPNMFFIETGSYMGDGISQAIEANFDTIISIELSDKYYNICKQKFKNYQHVNIIKGDSSEVLPSIIGNIDHPITFWLDGHYSCGDTACGKYWAPLIQELEAIKNHKINHHTILIDDMRCWKSFSEKHGFDTSDIIKMLNHINSNYNIEYADGYTENDILIAYV